MRAGGRGMPAGRAGGKWGAGCRQARGWCQAALLHNLGAPSLPCAARIVGATMMWGLSGKLKKKYQVEGDVRDALYTVRFACWACGAAVAVGVGGGSGGWGMGVFVWGYGWMLCCSVQGQWLFRGRL